METFIVISSILLSYIELLTYLYKLQNSWWWRKYHILNPNSIGVKYSLIVSWGEGYLHHVSVLISLLVKSFFLIETLFVMTKAVLNREICFIKAVILSCEHGHHILQNLRSHGVNSPPPPILLGLTDHKCVPFCSRRFVFFCWRCFIIL